MKNAKNIRTIIACATLAMVPAICLTATPINHSAAAPTASSATAPLVNSNKANI